MSREPGAFVIVAGSIGGFVAGTWLGLTASVLVGLIVVERGLAEDVIAAAVAGLLLTVLARIVWRAGGWAAAGRLLAVTAIAATNVIVIHLLAPVLGACLPPPENGPVDPLACGSLGPLVGFSPTSAVVLMSPAIIVSIISMVRAVRDIL